MEEVSKHLAQEVLRKPFQKQSVVTMINRYTGLNTRSRMSCFRRLRDIGWHSCYSHAGKYYTLTNIPHFDAHGLWHFQGIGFSSSGNLKNTIATLVEKSSCGLTSRRLEKLLQVRVHYTLLDLVRHHGIRREQFHCPFIYLIVDHDKAEEQLTCFRKQRLKPVPDRRPDWVRVEVLAAAIRFGGFLPERVSQWCQLPHIQELAAADPAYRIAPKQNRKYEHHLFAGPIKVKTRQETILIQPQRTNNLMERFFRDFKRKNHKRSGFLFVAPGIRAMIANTPQVKNLENPQYLEVLLHASPTLADRFVDIDVKMVREKLTSHLREFVPGSTRFRWLARIPDLPACLSKATTASVVA